MDLVQIGKFIAELRKEKGFTQEQLGEKVGVTNKTVSRWETGTYLPPVEALLSMSEVFDVSINELLSAKRLSVEAYREAAEKNLAQTIQASHFSLREKIAFYKKKWLKEHVAVMGCWGAGVVGAFVVGVAFSKPLLVSVSVILFVLGHAWRNNAMMAYVERHAYDGTGDRCNEKLSE